MSVPSRLYKYMPPERVSVIRSRLFRFTQAGALNDPFELSPFFNAIIDRRELEDSVLTIEPDWDWGIERMWEQLAPEVRARVTKDQIKALFEALPNRDELIAQSRREILPEVLRLEQDMTAVARDGLIRGLRERIGIFSLTEDPRSAPMWAHYAADHRGVVVEFDATNAWFHRKAGEHGEFHHLRPVVYVRGEWAVSKLADLGADILVRKTAEWETEREWRVLAPISEADDRFTAGSETVALFAVPPEAIVAIIVGANASGETKDLVVSALNGWPTPRRPLIRQAQLDRAGGKLTIE